MTRRILVAEPSRTLATLIQLTLRGVDAQLEFAGDGRDALTAARERTPDLLITEAELPGLDGFALIGAVRGLPGCQAMPVLLTVSDHATPDPERLAYLGISDVLSKPFERAALLERVRALLDAAPTPEPVRNAHALEMAPQRPMIAADAAPHQAPLAERVDAAAMTAEIARQLPEAMAAAVERVLPALVAAAVERLLEPLVEAAVGRALAALVTREVDQVLAPLVGATVEAMLPDAVTAELPAAVVGMALLPLQRAAEAAVAEALPELLQQAGAGLGPWVEAVLRDVLPRVVPDIAEKIVWKVVPEIAEDLVREEIRRLTEEGEQ